MATSTDLRAAIEEVQNQLPEGQLDGELEGVYEADFATKLEQRVGALPWWVISAVVHSVIFLLATLLTVALPKPQLDEVTITADVARKEQPEYDPKKKRDIFKNPQDVEHETQVENPVVVHEQTEVTDHFETENDMDNQNARGQEDAISDIPLGGTGVTGSMGVGGGGMAGCFGYRDGGGRKRAVARFGGSPATESAVEAALRWLARHQEKNGSWSGARNGDGSHGHVRGLERGADAGLTGLALLAFLGAGHTHKVGRFKGNVNRAVRWLIRNQEKKGRMAGAVYTKPWHRPGGGYGHAIAGLALAEAYGMSRDPLLRGPAQAAVDYSLRAQQTYSGWRYFPKWGKKEGTNADVSVTGWYVMQLKSAKIAGLRVDGAGFQGAQNLVDKCTDEKGRSGYSGKAARRPAMTAVALVCRLFMGARNTDPMIRGGTTDLCRYLPDWKGNYRGNPGGDTGFYYWYYATLAMFQAGGDKWTRWNTALKPTLVNNQCKGGPMDGSEQDLDGSWHPNAGNHGNVRKGMRTLSTALGALTLEVYYRYLPMYAK